MIVNLTVRSQTVSLQVAALNTGGPGGASDHGALSGLADDDHPQYLNAARGDARYDAIGAASAAVGAHAGATDPHGDRAYADSLAVNYATAAQGVFADSSVQQVDIGVSVQAYDADLDTWSGITPAAGIGTFLAIPSSTNLAAAVTDETGSGALVFATSPTLVTPALGTPSSGTLTNCTGYPAASTSASGIVELAIASEVSTGTDSTRAMTVDSYKKSTPFYTSRTADWTLALTDVNVDQWFNNGASALVCTIPLNATVSFAVGDTIPLLRLSSGTATIDAATSVTLNGVSGGSCTIQTQYQGALLKKVGTDTWIVSGDVSAVA